MGGESSTANGSSSVHGNRRDDNAERAQCVGQELVVRSQQRFVITSRKNYLHLVRNDEKGTCYIFTDFEITCAVKMWQVPFPRREVAVRDGTGG